MWFSAPSSVLQIYTDFQGFQRISMDFQRISTFFQGFTRILLVFDGFSFVFHGFHNIFKRFLLCFFNGFQVPFAFVFNRFLRRFLNAFGSSFRALKNHRKSIQNP